MNWTGLVLGLFSAVVIGLGFVWVIRFEYYVGAHRWKWVAAAGLLVCGSSLLMPNLMLSAVVGIIGGSITWGALELPHQAERVDHGLFKSHPDRSRRPRPGASSHGAHGSRPGLGKWWSF